VHFLRNLLSHLPKAGQDVVATAMKAVCLNKEIKHRTNVVGISPNDAAIVPLVGSQLQEQQGEWQLERRRFFSEGSITKIPESDQPLKLTGAD
jgi:transposase-like protein